MWQTLLTKITKPTDDLIHPMEREQAQLFALSAFGIWLVATSFGLIAIFSSGITRAVTIPSITNIVFFTALYLLSRTRYYAWSMRLIVWYSFLSITVTFFYVLTNPSYFILNFLAIPLLLSGFLLRLPVAMANMVGLMIMLLLMDQSVPDLSLDFSQHYLLLVQIGPLSMIAARVNRANHQRAITNEARYQRLLEANYEGIFVVDTDDARITDCNPAIYSMLGYEADEILGRYPLEFVHSEDKSIVRDAWEKRRENIPYAIRIVHKQGHAIYVEARLRNVVMNGQTGYVLTLIDISDRKQAESLILESEERFRAIFNGSTHYIGVLDARGKIIEINDTAQDTFGYDNADVIGKNLWELERWAYSDYAREQMKVSIAQATAGHSVRYDAMAYDKDHNPVDLDFSLQPILNEQGAVHIIVAESRDTTAYHQAEQQRREFENRYTTLFENTTDAVFILSMDGIIVDANERGAELLGASRNELIGQQSSQFVAKAEHAASQARFQSLVEGEILSNVSEREMRRADGRTFSAESMGIVVDPASDEDPYILSMVRDISARKRLEQERFETALEQERTEMLAHFIENASHHFRTPITNLKTRMYLLPRVLERPKKLQEQIEIMNQEIERLQNILNDLLMVLRLQKDDTEYSLASLPVNQLISEVRQTFEGRNNYHDYTWHWHLNDDNPNIFGDRVRLAHAIVNLVQNAITYTPQGGTITINSFTSESLVAIDVIDTGSGISATDLPLVFNDFYRGQDAMASDSTSSGLGLTITRMTIERHHGKVFADSVEGHGTHFQIVLPIHKDWKTPKQSIPDAMLTSLITGDGQAPQS